MNTIYLILKSKLFKMLLFVLCIVITVYVPNNKKISEKAKGIITTVIVISMYILIGIY